MRKLITVLGTRPEIIKMAPLIPLFDANFEHTLVHTGQHYSEKMDSIFFTELGLRKPDIHLEVGSSTSAAQVGRIMERLDPHVIRIHPAGVVVQGDTNTTLAGALVAAKHRDQGTQLFHIEALVRSFDRLQPEELNRRVVDSLADHLFALHEYDLENAKSEGIDLKNVSVFGNTVAEACLRIIKRVDDDEILRKFGLSANGYIFLTCHRQETVDAKDRLSQVCRAIEELSQRYPVVFPVHPRTALRIREFGLPLRAHANLKILEPLGYLETMGLLKNSRFCLSDSGGILEEAAVLKIPVLILRNEVEQTYFLDAGIHELVSPTHPAIMEKASNLIRSDSELQRRKTAKFSLTLGAPEKITTKIKLLLG